MLSLMSTPSSTTSCFLRDLTVMTFKGNTSVFVGLANYAALMHDPEFLTALGQTFWFTIACITVQFALGLLMAVFFSGRFSWPGRSAARSLWRG